MYFLYKLCFSEVYKYYQRKDRRNPQVHGWGVTSIIFVLHILPLVLIINLFYFKDHILSFGYLVVIFILPYIFNYFICLHNNQWSDFIDEVNERKERSHIVALVSYLIVLLIINASVVIISRSFYELSY